MRLVAIACFCALAGAFPAAAENADILGSWTVNFTLQSGPTPPSTLTLRNDGAGIGGMLSGQQGDMPVEASIKERAVTIWFTVPTESGPVAVTMNGTADRDAIRGTADLGGHGQAQWTATRLAAGAAAASQGDSRVDVTGTWAMTVESAAGTGTPTVVLKQDGEKLTGQYSGQLGEAPVTGTVKGTAVEFSFDVSFQGTALHIIYSGTAEASSMRGTVKLGDFGEGTFTGKKK
jgi:hypothetical protein